jgi:short-subunit dehydrogenase
MANAGNWRHVWITGGSSGIGRELALALARQGINVSVSARTPDQLAELADTHDLIHAYPVDVTDRAGVAAALIQIELQHGPVDLAILNAGTWSPSAPGGLRVEEFIRSMETNYAGVTNALVPLEAAMRTRGKGHIAVVASVAGYRGLPRGAFYGPTKAALINLCESLRPEFTTAGIKLQIICPGFVRTPMTDVNTFPMPFLMETDDAVARILAGLSSNRFEIAFPWQLVMILKLAQILPYPAFFWFIRNVIART